MGTTAGQGDNNKQEPAKKIEQVSEHQESVSSGPSPAQVAGGFVYTPEKTTATTKFGAQSQSTSLEVDIPTGSLPPPKETQRQTSADVGNGVRVHADSSGTLSQNLPEGKRDAGQNQPRDGTTVVGAQTVKEAPGKGVTPPANDGGAGTVTQRVGGQGGEVITPAQSKLGEVKTSTAPTDGALNRSVAQGEQPQTLNRGVATNQGDKAASGDKVGGATTVDNSGARKIEPPASTVGAPLMAPARNGEMPAGTQSRPAVSSDGTAGNVANTGVKAELHQGAKPVQDGTTALPSGQQKVEAKLDGGSVIQPGGAQPKVESARLETPKLETPKLEQPRLDSQNAGQPRLEPAKGSDVFSTQSSTAAAANRQDGFKSADPKVEGVRPADQAGSRDGSTMRDPKSVGVANEVFGQKNESGARGDSQSGGFKPDGNTAGQKADQITRGIESRVNEGAKQPGTTDGASGTTGTTRQPLAETGGKSPGITDGAQPGAKQTGLSDNIGSSGSGKQPGAEGASTATSPNIRQPLSDGGDKGSSGGGSSVAESTKRVDLGMPQGGKSDGQTGSSGMGGGSSASIDRAPHAPFRVEDAQPGGAKGDIAAGGKGEAVVGGKGNLGGEGPRFDSGETRGGHQPGARFDVGETRGTQQGTRFDTGEVKDGRGVIPAGGKSGDVGGGATGPDSGIVKGTDVSGTKTSGGGAGSGGSGGSGGAEGGLLGDKRQPPMFPETTVNQGGKPGKPGDGIGHAGGDDSVPFILPGAFSGKDGGRRQSDQIFGDKTKGDSIGGKAESGAKTESTGKADSTGKQEPGATAGKFDSGSMIAKFDALVSGRPDPTVASAKGESSVVGAKGDPSASSTKGDSSASSTKGEAVSANSKDKGTKADAGISAAMAGQVGTGAAEVGSVLKNFAQSVLSDGKSGQGNDGKVAQESDAKTVQGADGKTVVSSDFRDSKNSGKAQSGSEIPGKETPNARQDFAGPGQKTRILDQTSGTSDTKVIGDIVGPRAVGPGSIPADAAKRSELVAGSGIADANLPGGAGGDDVGKISTDDFNLPEVNLLGESDESEKVEEIEEVEESEEAKREDEMHYELALGLQLYTSIAEAPYGAYHYFTKDGDTVESVSREVVGDARTAPLVFSLNKDHILASTEYGVHPFKVGVMVQLPTPRDLKNFFGSQT